MTLQDHEFSDAPHVAIIGAGVSGTVAAQALARSGARLRITLIDPSPGRGPAYDTRDDALLLNTRIGNMSLDPRDPDDLLSWLRDRRADGPTWDRDDFLPRRIFGDYLEDRLLRLCDLGLGGETAPARVRIARSRALGAARDRGRWRIKLASGDAVEADALVLATGNNRPRPLSFVGREQVHSQVLDDPWDERAIHRLPETGTVLLVGTGLTAADVCILLMARRPRLNIVAVSRRGLRPLTHGAPEPANPRLQTPYPRTARELLGRVRLAAESLGSDPRDRHGLFLSLRKIAPALWAALPPMEKERFLRHLRVWWEVERHRIAPVVARQIDLGVLNGHIDFRKGRLGEARPLRRGGGARVALVCGGARREFDVVRIINCTGPETNPSRSQNPLLLNLLSLGAVPDFLGLGLSVGDDLGLLRADGKALPGAYAIGSLTRGRVFEITGAPEIRDQAEKLAATLVGRLPLSAAARTPR